MTRYVVLYRAPQDVAQRFATASPEEAQEGLQKWVAWAERLGPALLDPGKPLGHPLAVTTAGVTETDSDIIGMSILEAGSREEAVSMVAGHHHLEWSDGCQILLLEEMAIPELES